LRGTLPGGGRASAPAIRFTDSSDASITDDALCGVEERQFRCDAPEGTLDLRISIPGHVPHYRWRVAAAAGEPVSLGAFHFIPGASLSGYLQAEEGSLRNVRLALEPSKGNTIHASITPAERGFFLLGPVEPGDYTLTAAQKGLISGRLPVTIRERQEARLRDALVLAKPRRVTLVITPPVNPVGRPWVVTLASVEPGLETVVSEGAASLDGTWTAENLARGRYELRIRPEGGPVWHVDDLAMDEAATTKSVTMRSTRFRGMVTLGGKPLAAKLTFGGEHMKHAIPWRSDEEGRFEGYLPVRTDDRWTVSVKSDAPLVNSTLSDVLVKTDTPSGVATVDIALPATSVDGEVVDENGAPAKHALVTISGNTSDWVQVTTDEKGVFQAVGLAHDRYRISAATFLKESEAIEVDLSDPATEPVSIRLQVNPYRQWKGRVMGTDGRPVAGAKLFALPLDVPYVIGLPAKSDAEGHFSVLVPMSARTFDVMVRPPGYALTVFRRGLSAELTVVVSRHGGTLVLEVDGNSPLRPFLWHGGAAISAFGLASGWPAVFDELPDGMMRVRIPQMEPGDYTICMASPQQNVERMSPSGQCQSVFLTPHSESVVRLTN
jgi:Carboxypeptidase regulatory-like domain